MSIGQFMRLWILQRKHMGEFSSRKGRVSERKWDFNKQAGRLTNRKNLQLDRQQMQISLKNGYCMILYLPTQARIQQREWHRTGFSHAGVAAKNRWTLVVGWSPSLPHQATLRPWHHLHGRGAWSCRRATGNWKRRISCCKGPRASAKSCYLGEG